MALPAKSQKQQGHKPPPDKPRSYSSLFNEPEVARLYERTPANTRTVWRRAEHPSSLFYDLSQVKVTDAQFRTALSESPLKEVIHGAVIHRTRKHVIAEVAFNDAKVRGHYMHLPVTLADETKVFGTLPIPEDWDVIRINLSNIPLYNRLHLTEALIAALKPFGQILELGLYLEQHLFTGKGYVYLNVNPDSNDYKHYSSVPPLQPTHTISVSRKDGSYPARIYATWSKMPLHCRYCHNPGHTRIQCSYRPQPRCYHCQEIGHLRKDCTIRHGPQPTTDKTASPDYTTQETPIKRKRVPTSPSPSPTPFSFTPPINNDTSQPRLKDKPHDPHTDIAIDPDIPHRNLDNMDTSATPTSRDPPTDDMVT